MNLHSIETVEDAIAFLRTIDVEVLAIRHGWIVRGMDENTGCVELTCVNSAGTQRSGKCQNEIGHCAPASSTTQFHTHG